MFCRMAPLNRNDAVGVFLALVWTCVTLLAEENLDAVFVSLVFILMYINW